jgi:hypothetical protein
MLGHYLNGVIGLTKMGNEIATSCCVAFEELAGKQTEAVKSISDQQE